MFILLVLQIDAQESDDKATAAEEAIPRTGVIVTDAMRPVAKQ